MEPADRFRIQAVFRTLDAEVDLCSDDLALVAQSIADHNGLPADVRDRMLRKGHDAGFVSRVEAIGVRALRAEAQRSAVLVRVQQVGIAAAVEELMLDEPALQLLRESQARRPSEVLAAILADVG